MEHLYLEVAWKSSFMQQVWLSVVDLAYSEMMPVLSAHVMFMAAGTAFCGSLGRGFNAHVAFYSFHCHARQILQYYGSSVLSSTVSGGQVFVGAGSALCASVGQICSTHTIPPDSYPAISGLVICGEAEIS